MTAEKTTTYILDLKNDGQRRVTVPSKWKVTFGPAVPYAKGQPNYQPGYALRFYEGTSQRAIFTDVSSFRDASIPIEEKVTRTKQQTMHKRHGSGMKDVVVEASVTEWRNPDKPEEPTEEFLQIEGNKVSF